MFSNPENPRQGFSAVRGLELAAAQGQRIFQIDQSNVNEVMPQLNLDFEVEAEIRDSVRAGLMVVTHTNNVSVPGFTGAGYLVLDPNTLIGAYMISGGANGGNFLPEGFAALGIAAVGVIGVVGGVAIAPILIFAALSVGIHIIALELAFNPNASFEEVEDQILVIVSIVLGLAGFLNIALLTAAAFIIGTILGIYSLVS